MASDLNDEEFRNELLELFSLEAEEWLQQTRTAFQELQHDDHGSSHAKLLDIMQQALSNLGGSAATVELPEIEHLAFSLLPHLQSVREAAGPAAAEHLGPLRGHLDQLADAIRKIPGATAEDEAEVAAAELDDGDDAVADPARETPHISIDALRHVQHELAQAGRAARNLVDLVIERAREEGDEGADRFDKSAVTRALRELEGLDEHFLAEAQTRMPEITQAVAHLKTLQEKDLDVSDTLAPVIHSVQALRETAHQARAAGIMQFLQGLSTFLTIVTERGVSLVLGRLDAVEFRLGAVIPMIQQWVEMGRIEREAIGAALSG